MKFMSRQKIIPRVHLDPRRNISVGQTRRSGLIGQQSADP